jgi:hypothetical protein
MTARESSTRASSARIEHARIEHRSIEHGDIRHGGIELGDGPASKTDNSLPQGSPALSRIRDKRGVHTHG